MSLIKCKECGKEISSSAVSCPQCGWKVQRTSQLTKIIVLVSLVLLVLLLSTLNKPESNQPAPGTQKRLSASEGTRLAKMTPGERAEAEKKRKEEAAAAEERRLQGLGLRWVYGTTQDKMGRGTIRTAVVRSVNEVQFGFPYQGEQRGTLTLRIHPKYERDVILNIERGQFLCGIDGCVVSVRFDEGKPQTFSVAEPSDHDTTYVFITNYDRFLTSLRKSKRVYVEAEFYQEATRVFEFYVAGLKW